MGDGVVDMYNPGNLREQNLEMAVGKLIAAPRQTEHRWASPLEAKMERLGCSTPWSPSNQSNMLN
jgi:hypothetical protein